MARIIAGRGSMAEFLRYVNTVETFHGIESSDKNLSVPTKSADAIRSRATYAGATGEFQRFAGLDRATIH